MEVYNSSHTAEELEYALSAVPSIGENGNWYIGEEDTGIFAGGVDVTGAEVDQIVQISEVDENGRPTAWVPADFKLDEQWELIVDHTFEEVSYYGKFTTDMNGDPFDLKKAIVMWRHYPVVTTSVDEDSGEETTTVVNNALSCVFYDPEAPYGKTTIGANWCGNRNPGNSCHFYGLSSGGTAPSNGYSTIHKLSVTNEPGFITATSFYTSKNGSTSAGAFNVANVMAPYRLYRAIKTPDMVIDDALYDEVNKINTLVIGGIYGSIGVGTRVVMYGVRK